MLGIIDLSINYENLEISRNSEQDSTCDKSNYLNPYNII